MDPATLGGVALVASGAGLGLRRLRHRELRPPVRADVLALLAGRPVGEVLDEIVVDLTAIEAEVACPAAVVTRPAPVVSGNADSHHDLETLRQQRDLVAARVQAVFREIHAVRTNALRGAAEGERLAADVAVARERSQRRARDRHEAGRSLRTDAARLQPLHELRIDALSRSAQSERGADQVPRLRVRARRLLVEQRRLDAALAARVPSPA